MIKRIIEHSTMLAIAFTIQMTGTAQLDRSKAPEPGPAPSVELQKAEKFELDNGLKVIVVENHKLPKVDIQMKFDIEPIMQGDLVGYQSLMGDLLASGTRRYSKEAIDEKVDGAGAKLYTSRDGVFMSCLKQQFDPMMELVYAIATSATFPPAEFENEKNRMVSSLKASQDDPDAISSTVSKALTYRKAHPYGEVATVESVSKITRKQLLAYYERFFIPENAYLVFVGDITVEEARKVANNYFNSWEGAGVMNKVNGEGQELLNGVGIRYAEKQPEPMKQRLVCIVDKPGATQSIIKVAYPVQLKPDDPRLMAAMVMNTILGGGVFNARLMQNLREDKAYTYGAYASLGNDRLVTSWSGGASVRNEVTHLAVAQIILEMERITEEPVSEEELALAKNYLAGQFGRGLEDPRTIARFELNKEINGLSQDHYATYLQRLDSVTVQDVLEAAQAFILPNRATILVVGDKEEVGNSLKAFSPKQAVLEYDFKGDIYREITERAPAEITPKKIIDDYIAAIGGTSRLEGVNDLKITMSGQLKEQEVKTVIMKEKPNFYRSETTLGGFVVQKTVFDGKKAVLTDDTGYPKEMDKDVYDVDLSAAMFPELSYLNGQHRCTSSGSVQVKGEKAWKLNIQTSNGNVINEYYSAETGFKLKRMEREMTDNGMLEIVTYYNDYRDVAGIKFPHLVKQSAGLNFTLTVDEILIDNGLGEALFSTE